MPKHWEDLKIDLNPEIVTGIKSFGFQTVTPVQYAVIPQILNRKDVAAEAVTGSGKTLAFLIPILEILKRSMPLGKYQIAALILSPTRELALQISQVLGQFLQYVTGISQRAFIGGGTVRDNLDAFRADGAHILICTPGRLQDLLTSPQSCFPAALKSLEILVLDEADRLLDLGFENCLNTILGYVPRQRRTSLFSATQTKQVDSLIRAGLRNPVIISVSAKRAQNTPDFLENFYTITRNDNKFGCLLKFLQLWEKDKKIIVFLPTCACVDYWTVILMRFLPSTNIFSIHGKMKMRRRNVLDNYRTVLNGILLCTDVMARGIDIPEVDWVVQWDPPSSAASFIHRIGRTARQGHKGAALLLLLDNEDTYVPFIERNQRVQLTHIPDESTPNETIAIREKIRTFLRADRALMDKGVRAYVSHVRAYSKHECSLLLKVREWPLGAVAATYGLLKLPKMPELRNRDVSDFPIVADLDLDTVPYRDRVREGKRQEQLVKYRQTGQWPNRKYVRNEVRNVAWSRSQDNRKRRKEMKKREGGKRRCNKIDPVEMAELAKDIALIKKLKKRNLRGEEFLKEFEDGA